MIDPLAGLSPALFIANAVLGLTADIKEYIEDKRRLRKTVQTSGTQTVRTFELCRVGLVLSDVEKRALNDPSTPNEEKAQIFLAAVKRTEDVTRSPDVQKTKAWKRREQ
jgi:hypothetical protein